MIWVALQFTFWLFIIYSIIHVWAYKWGDRADRIHWTIIAPLGGGLLVSALLMTLVPMTVMRDANAVDRVQSTVVDVEVEDTSSGLSSWNTGQTVQWKTEDGKWHKGWLASNDEDKDANVRLVLKGSAGSSIVRQGWHSYHPLFWPFNGGDLLFAPDSYVLYVGKDLR